MGCWWFAQTYFKEQTIEEIIMLKKQTQRNETTCVSAK